MFYDSPVQVLNMARVCISEKGCPKYCGWCGVSCEGTSATDHGRSYPSSESPGHLLATTEEKKN